MEQMTEKERQARELLAEVDKARRWVADECYMYGKDSQSRKECEQVLAIIDKLIERDRTPGYTHEDVMRLVEAVRAGTEVAGYSQHEPAILFNMERASGLRAALAPFTHQAKDGSR